jgi:hypothetical protein
MAYCIIILLICTIECKVVGERVAKRRVVRLLLLPILIIIFAFGWLLNFAGEPQPKRKKPPAKAVKPEEVEIGVIMESPEEQAVAQQQQQKTRV